MYSLCTLFINRIITKAKRKERKTKPRDKRIREGERKGAPGNFLLGGAVSPPVRIVLKHLSGEVYVGNLGLRHAKTCHCHTGHAPCHALGSMTRTSNSCTSTLTRSKADSAKRGHMLEKVMRTGAYARGHAHRSHALNLFWECRFWARGKADSARMGHTRRFRGRVAPRNLYPLYIKGASVSPRIAP